MMNQTKKHTTSKKLLALLLALIMTVSLLPMSVFAAAVDVPETEPQVTEPVEEDVQEPEVTDVEGEGDADVQNMEGGAAVYADAAQINYVTRTQSVPLKDGTFYRIVHIDCGRKYFSVTDLKKIIDYAAASNYTHVELAFGNDGLRFLLDDMEVTASGVTYASETVRSAIQEGNKAFYDAGTNELTQTQMNDIISYANGKGIGIIPMFDAPGHLQAVIRAMQTLKISMVENTDYCRATKSGTSYNWALIPTNVEGNNFVQELVQKYINYFKTQGCTMFNIAADECGFSYNSDTRWSGMSNEQYTAYTRFVNSMAARVQNAGMVALAFNDGIYHKNLTTSVEFDTNIAVCYWDASSDKYAPAADLATKGFKIINTNNKWYYVLGSEGTGWFGYQWAQDYMNNSNKDCRLVDGGYYTDAGCMLALWCDTPSADVNWTNVENHIKTLSKNNSTYFTKVEVPEEVELPAVNDPETKVSVVVKGQEGQPATVKVKKLTARTEGLPASAEKAVSYEITPSVENTAYTGAGKVTLPVPAEWKDNTDRVRGYIVTDGKVETIRGSYDAATGKYTFDVTHFSEMGLILLAADSTEVTENRTITVTVGGTATDTIKNANYEGTYTYKTEDPSKATVVSAKHQNVAGKQEFTPATSVSSGKYYIKSGDTYLKLSSGSVTWVSNIKDATELMATSSSNGFKLRDASTTGNNYLRYRYGEWQGGSNSSNATTLYFDASEQTLCRTRNEDWWGNITYTNPLGTPGTLTITDPVDQTTITFEGVAEGTTYVTIGHVRYTINVTKENLDGVDPLPMQLWFTNCDIQAVATENNKQYTVGQTTGEFVSGSWQDNKKPYYVSVSAGDAYGKDGVPLSAVLPETMLRYENSNTYWQQAYTGKVQKELVLWSGRVHSSNIQLISGKDYSNTGTEFEYVRYYGGAWAVSTDRVNWTTVTGSGTTASSSTCTEQLAVYYMMRSEITKEVTTDVADWGYISSDEDYSKQIKTGNYVMLDFAVKYEGGTRNPADFPQDGKTFVFHCTPNDGSGSVKQDSNSKYYRQLNNFRGVNTSDYEIYMVTVTMTEDAASDTLSSTTSYAYNGEEQIVWAIDEATRDNSNLNEYQAITSGDTTYSGCDIGGDPYVRGVEVYNKHGALITYYIRTRAVEGQLTVHYIDKATGNQFHSYNIIGKDINDPTQRFKETIALNQPNWKGDLIDGDVVNNRDVTQIVSSDLSTMPSVPPAYRYAIDYQCVEVTRNEERTDVYLYYEFVGSKTFVVDFGLPLKITPADFSAELKNATLSKVSVTDSAYATITTDAEKNVIYTLNKTIDGEDTITVAYDGNITVDGEVQSGFVSYTVKVIPAANVYYEDSFATFSNGAGAAADAKWSTDGTEQTANQLLEVLGDKTNLYGYDKAYENCTTFSMGSAHKVTVTADMAKNWANHTDSAWPTATFTFKGTGFDVISLTDNDSGVITCEVKNAKGEKVYSTFINNYYGYKYENGSFVKAANGSNNKLYQLPIIKVAGQPYDTYTVTLTAAYGEYFDKTGDSQYSFWLDAIRVYDPMGKNYAGYNQENEKEGYPQYFELRDALATTDTGNYKAVLIEGTDAAEQTDYRNFGPNHEVYLAKDQTLAFKLDGDLSKIATVQLGLKAVDGAATYTIGSGEAKTVKTATDMYYDITEAAKSGTILIRNTGNTILSLTNVKVTFTEGATASLAIMSDTAINEAVQMVRAMYAPEEVQPFTPERFEASWNRSSVRAGEKATLTVKTSEDVAAITVDGVTIDTYRTRTQRTGWGWNAKKVTYREFTYTITASETANHEIVAVNAEGTASEAIHALLTVRAAAQRPGIGGWLNKLFSSWF